MSGNTEQELTLKQANLPVIPFIPSEVYLANLAQMNQEHPEFLNLLRYAGKAGGARVKLGSPWRVDSEALGTEESLPNGDIIYTPGDVTIIVNPMLVFKGFQGWNDGKIVASRARTFNEVFDAQKAMDEHAEKFPIVSTNSQDRYSLTAGFKGLVKRGDSTDYQEVKFESSSRGGMDFMAKLGRELGVRTSRFAGAKPVLKTWPVLQLGEGSYTKKQGDVVFFPDFEVVDWIEPMVYELSDEEAEDAKAAAAFI